MRTPNLLLAVAGTVAAGAVQAENSISYQTYHYKEADNRIKVSGSNLAVEKDFGTDYTVNLYTGYDTVSGATPMWQAKPGYANEFVHGRQKVAEESRQFATGSILMRDAARNEYSFGLSYSKEPDYESRGFSTSAQLWHDENKNRAYIVGARMLFNTAIATAFTNHTTDQDSTVLNLQAGVSQVIDPATTLEASVYYNRDSGYLSNQYLKIVRVDASGLKHLSNDTRPDERHGGGFALKGIKSWRDDLTTHLGYRFYQDDWGITGHTVEAKAYYDLTPVWRINPVARLHRQSEADFYRAYGASVNTFAMTGYGANDPRLGELTGRTLQLNLEYHPSREWSLNIGATRYTQDTGLSTGWVTAGFVLKY